MNSLFFSFFSFFSFLLFQSTTAAPLIKTKAFLRTSICSLAQQKYLSLATMWRDEECRICLLREPFSTSWYRPRLMGGSVRKQEQYSTH
jgi:hypothetical protein